MEEEQTPDTPRHDEEDEPVVYAVSKTDAGWNFSRRDFLAAAGAVAAVTAAGSLAGCARPPQPAPPPTAAPAVEQALAPTAAPPPTDALAPTATAAPTDTPEPTSTPSPTRTGTPTRTPKPTATDTPTKTPTNTRPPAPSARFVSDVTIPDDTVMSPRSAFTKTWRVKNTGTTAWPAGTKLVFLSGNLMGAQKSVPVPAAKPGETVDLSVDMTTPEEVGPYRSGWRLQTASGAPFGDELWTKLVVATKNDIAEGDRGVRFTTTVGGETVTWTMPCGSAIPAGAVCTCNCVSVPVSCGCNVHTNPCSCNAVTYHYWYPN